MRAVCGRRRRRKESHWNQKYMFITCRLSFMVSSSRVVKKKWNWSSTKMYRHLIRSHDVKPRAGFDRQQPKWIENNKNTTKSTLMLIGPFNSRFSFCVANSLPSSLRFVHFLHIIPINYVYDDEKINREYQRFVFSISVRMRVPMRMRVCVVPIVSIFAAGEWQ